MASDSKHAAYKGFSTRALHVGQEPDAQTGAVAVPISLATTFAQASPGVTKGFEYSRTGNPTRQAFEKCIASLENGKYGLAFASGSAATVTIINTLNSGDHVISVDDVYGGTQRYFRKVANPAMNIDFTFVDTATADTKTLEAAFTPKTKIVWLETPTNPTLKISDIKKIAEITHAKNAILVVDNTFLSPALQNPLDLGADIVVHSVTKYINGHSDVVMGVMAMNDQKLHERLAFLQNSIGAIPAPFDCYMALRGVRTLKLRMEAHSANAMKVATFLESHAQVQKVVYPGLASHPQHELAKKQQKGFGGMITFFIKGGLVESKKFLEALKIFICAESLGAVESLAEHPAIMTHASVPSEMRAQLGISDNLIRLSVGIEESEDLIADLTQALAASTQ